MPAMEPGVRLKIMQVQEHAAIPTGPSCGDQLAIDEADQVFKRSSQLLQVRGKICKE
jgi:hypothetical protein